MATVINWRRVLESASIEYVERGPNVKKGELNIQCPFCGAADSSHHMGLRPDNGWWACWRNADHRGKSPVRLLVRLLGVSYNQAREMAGFGESYVDPDGFSEVAAKLLRQASGQLFMEEPLQRTALSMRGEFMTIRNTGRTARFWDYLVSRDFHKDDIYDLCVQYRLRAAVGGDFKDRIILPYIVHNRLATWSGRAIGEATLRYRDLSVDEAGVTAKSLLYNHDCYRAKGCKALLVVEGPFDVLKLDFYGQDEGVRAVGLSTNNITEEQIYELETLAPYFGRVIVMLDTATDLGVVDSMRMKSRLSQIQGLEIAPVPFGRKDGGALTPREVIHFTKGIKI